MPKSKGTAIAIHKSCPFQPLDNKIDPQGRYVFLKGSVAVQTYTFATIYAPNTNQLTFIDSTLALLAEFREGLLVLGGDLNMSPDPSLDTSHTRSPHSFAFLKHFRKTIQSHLLLDCWRVLLPSDRDFSYYSKVHDVYTRIDHIYVDRATLEFLQEASIGNITISDHVPVNVTLTLPSGGHRTWTWRMNSNLLDDEVVVKSVSDTLTHYFRENSRMWVMEWYGRSIRPLHVESWSLKGPDLKKSDRLTFWDYTQHFKRRNSSIKQTGILKR